MNMNDRMEILIRDLCAEIDTLRDERDRYRKSYEEMRAKCFELCDERIHNNKQTVATLITSTLGE